MGKEGYDSISEQIYIISLYTSQGWRINLKHTSIGNHITRQYILC